LKPEQLLELYRYLKLTRLVEERLVNLYRQTKIVFRWRVSFPSARKLRQSELPLLYKPQDFLTPIIRDLGGRVCKRNPAAERFFAQYMAKAWGPSAAAI